MSTLRSPCRYGRDQQSIHGLRYSLLPSQVCAQGPSLRDTQYVLGTYVTMYIAKERNKSIAQVGILTNALLVQYIC